MSPLVIPHLLRAPEITRPEPATWTAPAPLVQQPTRVVALIGELALHQDWGRDDEAVRHLWHLADLARLSTVELGIVPMRQWNRFPTAAFTLIDSHRGVTSAIVDTHHSTLWMHRPRDVHAYQQAISKITAFAWEPDRSLDLVTDTLSKIRDAPG